eukprot:TRINITY_DN8113_c0_g1_i1.p1 TRINITY_DN8113_c0_g1~~TRINITY_DN8113_c0_g1_i1.p1  ORF type:complete len:128 (-),score=34.84 TRINITY_DN8113_c0_g1_i1:134-517(-)
MSWQTYVDSNLVGSGHVTQGAMLSAADGSVWATSAGFTVAPAEGAAVVAALADIAKFQQSGITVNGVKYFCVKAAPGELIGKKGAAGIAIYKSAQAILVGVYGEGINPANCNMTVEGLKDYLVGVGY